MIDIYLEASFERIIWMPVTGNVNLALALRIGDI